MLQIAARDRPDSLQLPRHQQVAGLIDARIGAMRSSGLMPRQPTTDGLQEQLFDSAASFKVAFSQISMHLPKAWRDGLFKQLDSLLDVDEWDERDVPPMAQSQLTFIRLLLTLRPNRRPGLGATQDGHLIATWTVGRDRLTIECLADDHVTWSLSRIRAEEAERAAGTTKIVRMTDVLAPYDPSVWFDHAK